VQPHPPPEAVEVEEPAEDLLPFDGEVKTES